MKLKATKNFNHSGVIGVLGEHLREDPGQHLEFLLNEGFVMIDDPEVQAKDEPGYQLDEEDHEESVLPAEDVSEDKHPKKKKKH